MRLLSVAILFLPVTNALAGDAPTKHIDPNPDTGTAAAVVVENVPLVHTAQFLPLDAQGKIVGKGDAAAQIERVLANLSAALAESRSSLDRVVKVNVSVKGPEMVAEVHKAFGKQFPAAARPAVSFVAGALPHPDALVAFDAVATTSLDLPDDVKHFSSGKLHRSTGSHAAILPPGARVYVSGQAEKGKDLAEATQRTMESLRATLKFLELNDTHVVQLKAFLHPMAKVDNARAEIAKSFGDRPVPPLVFVEWNLALPIEIELIAAAGKERKGEVIEYLTPPEVKASPVYSRVARINRGPSIYVSGLYGSKAKNAEAEIEEIFTGLEKLLTKTGSDLRHMAKATYYVSTDEASKMLNDLRPRYYDPKRPPAASKAGVPGVGVEGKTITLDMIAVPAPRKP